MHIAGEGDDFVEVTEDVAVAVDMGLEHFPVVDAGLAGRAGIGEQEAHLDFFRRDGHGSAANAIGIEIDGADAAVEGGIIILAAGGHADDLSLDVLGESTRSFSRSKSRPVKRARAAQVAIMRARRTGDASAGGRFGIGFETKTGFWGEEAGGEGGDGMTGLEPRLSSARSAKDSWRRVSREWNSRARAGQRRDAAGGENLQREVERQGAGMKQVERPKIDGAACEIGAAGSVGGDGAVPPVGE